MAPKSHKRDKSNHLKSTDTGRTAFKSCHSKTRYANEYEVQRAITKCKEQRPKTKLRAYWCHRCGGFHLSSRPDLDAASEEPE